MIQGWLNGWADLVQDRCRDRGVAFLGMMVGLPLFIPVLNLEDENPLWHFSFSEITYYYYNFFGGRVNEHTFSKTESIIIHKQLDLKVLARIPVGTLCGG